jgi:hypothetical protein
MKNPKLRGPIDPASQIGQFFLNFETAWRQAGGSGTHTPKDFRQFFFPFDRSDSTDRIFRHLTAEERADLVFGWHICGRKMAIRYSAERITEIVLEAFLEGDLDDERFAESIGPDLVLRRVPIEEWWRFFMLGKFSKPVILKFLNLADAACFIDASWFFAKVKTTVSSGRMNGLDALSAVLTKTDLADWLLKLHRIMLSHAAHEQDLLAALGFETVVAKMALEDLQALVAEFGQRFGLTEAVADSTPTPVPAPPPEDKELEAALGRLTLRPAADVSAPAAPAETPPERDGRESVPLLEVSGGDGDVVSEDELVAVPPSEGAQTTAATDPASVDWGAFPPDAERSAAEALARGAGEGKSDSSLNRAPDADGGLAVDVTLPSTPPPRPAPRPSSRRAGPPPLPGGK